MTKTCATPGCPKSAKGTDRVCAAHRRLLTRYGTTDLATAHPLRSDGACRYACGHAAINGGACRTHQGHAVRDGFAAKQTAEQRRAYRNSWKASPDYRAYLAARKVHVKRATPAWADLSAITKFYRACPKGSHVDHIIPLRGERVSGLHVLPNLQYLTARANMSKGARYTTVRYDPLGLMAEAA